VVPFARPCTGYLTFIPHSDGRIARKQLGQPTLSICRASPVFDAKWSGSLRSDFDRPGYGSACIPPYQPYFGLPPELVHTRREREVHSPPGNGRPIPVPPNDRALILLTILDRDLHMAPVSSQWPLPDNLHVTRHERQRRIPGTKRTKAGQIIDQRKRQLRQCYVSVNLKRGLHLLTRQLRRDCPVQTPAEGLNMGRIERKTRRHRMAPKTIQELTLGSYCLGDMATLNRPRRSTRARSRRR